MYLYSLHCCFLFYFISIFFIESTDTIFLSSLPAKVLSWSGVCWLFISESWSRSCWRSNGKGLSVAVDVTASGAVADARSLWVVCQFSPTSVKYAITTCAETAKQSCPMDPGCATFVSKKRKNCFGHSFPHPCISAIITITAVVQNHSNYFKDLIEFVDFFLSQMETPQSFMPLVWSSGAQPKSPIWKYSGGKLFFFLNEKC